MQPVVSRLATGGSPIEWLFQLDALVKQVIVPALQQRLPIQDTFLCSGFVARQLFPTCALRGASRAARAAVDGAAKELRLTPIICTDLPNRLRYGGADRGDLRADKIVSIVLAHPEPSCMSDEFRADECLRALRESCRMLTPEGVPKVVDSPHLVPSRMRSFLRDAPLLSAAKDGDCAAIMKQLRLGAEANRLGLTALMCSAAYGQLDAILLLAQVGAAIDDRTLWGRTALGFAAGGGQVRAARKLLLLGADAASVDNDGVTVLHRAVESGSVDTVRVIAMSPEVDVNRPQLDLCTTPLLKAIRLRLWDIVRALVTEFNADVTIVDFRGDSALHLAAAAGAPEDIVRLLAGRQGVDVNLRNRAGRTTLHTAAYCRNWKLVALLVVGFRADATIRDADGITVLGLAEGGGAAAEGHSPRGVARFGDALYGEARLCG